jgi:hypothetical protein
VSALQNFIQNKLKEVKAVIPKCLLKAVVEELAHAIDPPVHEGVFPTYGAIIASGTEPMRRRLNPDYGMRQFSLDSQDNMRSMSDGICSFYFRHIIPAPCEKAEVLIIEARSFESEAALFSLRDEAVYVALKVSHNPSKKPDNDVMIVQRNRSGEVTLLCSSGIIVIRGYQWSQRIYQYDIGLDEICENILGSKESPTVDVYRSLASLALHILGAKRIGATIIVDGGEIMSGERSILQSSQSISVRDADLNVTKKSHQRLIAHILASNDGAALFSSDGLLISVKNWLDVKIGKEDDTPGGTRQATAREASKKIVLPVITVSADGPVRVFHKGEMKKEVS